VLGVLVVLARVVVQVVVQVLVGVAPVVVVQVGWAQGGWVVQRATVPVEEVVQPAGGLAREQALEVGAIPAGA